MAVFVPEEAEEGSDADDADDKYAAADDDLEPLGVTDDRTDAEREADGDAEAEDDEPRCEQCGESFYDPGGRTICDDCDGSLPDEPKDDDGDFTVTTREED
jgi:hypothetical protein